MTLWNKYNRCQMQGIAVSQRDPQDSVNVGRI